MKTFFRDSRIRPYCTQKNDERVRSMGEQEIADFLYDHRIKYVYEPVLKFPEKTIRPDFYLIDYDIFIEYFGCQGDKQYNWKIKKKKDLYKKYNKNLISLWPKQMGNFGAYIRAIFQEISGKPFPQKKFFDWKIDNH